MNEILNSVQRVSDIIGEITAASSEQSQGIGHVNESVNQLDQMTQQNAALVEQSAAAAESLKDQAAKLSSAVSAFKLGQTRTAHQAHQATAYVAPKAPFGASKPSMKPAPAAATSAKAELTYKPATVPAERAALPQPTTIAAAPSSSGHNDDWETF